MGRKLVVVPVDAQLQFIEKTDEYVKVREDYKGDKGVLKVASMGLTEIDESIDRLSELTELDCSGNQLTILPKSISNMVTLKILHCHYNQLTTLPDNIGNLTHLEELDCHNNQLRQLPDDIGVLENLTEIDCSYNPLTALPDNIGKLHNLTILRFNGIQLTALPDTIGDLVKLTTLACNNNKLTFLPDNIDSLINLTELDCSSNHISKLPDGIVKLKNLKVLLHSFQSELQVLPKTENQVWEINSLGEITVKPFTDVAICPFRGMLLVPAEFAGTLDLSQARLSQVPESVFQLKKVTKLKLGYSTIFEIPEDIGRCENLRELDVSNNDVLKSFPQNLRNCTELRIVKVKGCQYAIKLLESLDASMSCAPDEKVHAGSSKHADLKDTNRLSRLSSRSINSQSGSLPVPKKKTLIWKKKPGILGKLIIKLLTCIVLLLLSIFAMHVMFNDDCLPPVPLNCGKACSAEALANQTQVSLAQCLSVCAARNHLHQVEACGSPDGWSQPERDDIHSIKKASVVLSMILLIPHIVDVGNMMDQVLQIPFREKLPIILERHDKLSERVSGTAGILKYNVYGFITSITNVLCCFHVWWFKSEPQTKTTKEKGLQNKNSDPNAKNSTRTTRQQTEPNPEDHEGSLEEHDSRLKQNANKVTLKDPRENSIKDIDEESDDEYGPLHSLERMKDLEAAKSLREVSSKCIPNCRLNCFGSLRQRCKAMFEPLTGVKWRRWMVVLVEWVDTVQTWSLFPLSYYVIMGSDNVGDVIVNVVAVSVFARLDDEAVEMFTRPQKSLLERWQLYSGSVKDLRNTGELHLAECVTKDTGDPVENKEKKSVSDSSM